MRITKKDIVKRIRIRLALKAAKEPGDFPTIKLFGVDDDELIKTYGDRTDLELLEKL